MPWCDNCSKFFTPASLEEQGSCPDCGTVIGEPPAPSQTTPAPSPPPAPAVAMVKPSFNCRYARTRGEVALMALTSAAIPSIPTNDYTVPDDYDVLGNSTFAQGNYDVTLAIDPNNPNITYVGGTLDGNPYGFLRVDATKMEDVYALTAYNNSKNDGGLIQFNTTGAISVKPATTPPGPLGPGFPYGIYDLSTFAIRPSYLNQQRDPDLSLVEAIPAQRPIGDAGCGVA